MISLSEDYLYTGISGVDDKEKIIQGHPPGCVAILYKKSFAGSITHIKSTYRRICGINLLIDHLSIIILSVYMPSDNQSFSVNSEYALCIDYIEQLLNMPECKYFIGAGDYNTSFSRTNAQTEIQDVIDRGISYDKFNRFRITTFIIGQCIIQLKTRKDDDSEGFNSNHLINGGHHMHILLSLLFNCMIVHGHTPKDLLTSTIISIPKDMRAALCKSDNYRGISLFNAICKVFDYVIMYLCDEFLYTSECN